MEPAFPVFHVLLQYSFSAKSEFLEHTDGRSLVDSHLCAELFEPEFESLRETAEEFAFILWQMGL